MALTDPLARSFFDLWHHLDPVAAGRFDPEAGPPELTPFDPDSVRQHVAALRSLGSAAEDLDPESLDDQIDQTLLLEAIRTVERAFGHDQAHRHSPAFRLSRLCAVLETQAGDESLLDQLPAWTAGAAVKSGAFELETGLTLLAQAGALLEGDRWERTPADLLARARAGLEELGQELRNQATAEEPASVVGIGEDALDWRLHFVYAVGAGSSESLKRVARLAAELEADLERIGRESGRDWREALAAPAEPGPPAGGSIEPWASFRDPIEPHAHLRITREGSLGPAGSRLSIRPDSPLGPAMPVRHGGAGGSGLLAARAGAGSEIRRRYAAPGLVDGWGLFVEDRARTGGVDPDTALLLTADLYVRTLVAALDLGLHRRQLAPMDALRHLLEKVPLPPPVALAEVRRAILHPAEAVGSVLVWREWTRLAARWPAGATPVEEAAFAGGLASPVLVAWRHGQSD